MGETENGVFVELEFLDTFLLFGQVKKKDPYGINTLIAPYLIRQIQLMYLYLSVNLSVVRS